MGPRIYMDNVLQQFLEDREDYLLAINRLEDDDSTIPYEKVSKQLGMLEFKNNDTRINFVLSKE